MVQVFFYSTGDVLEMSVVRGVCVWLGRCGWRGG